MNNINNGGYGCNQGITPPPGFEQQPPPMMLPPPMPGHIWHYGPVVKPAGMHNGVFYPEPWVSNDYIQVPYHPLPFPPMGYHHAAPHPHGPAAAPLAGRVAPPLADKEAEGEAGCASPLPASAAKAEKAVESVLSRSVDEEGDYEAAAVLASSPIDPLSLSGTFDSADVEALIGAPACVSPVSSPDSGELVQAEVDYDAALRNYRDNFRGYGHLRYPRHNRQYKTNRERALHYLPLSIIDNLEKLAYFRKLHIGELPTFLIPCSVSGKRTIQDGVIEFTLRPDGRPLHLFLRPYDGRDEAYFDKNLGDKQEDYRNAKDEADFPSLQAGLQHKEVQACRRRPVVDTGCYLEFWSPHHLRIRIKKNLED